MVIIIIYEWHILNPFFVMWKSDVQFGLGIPTVRKCETRQFHFFQQDPAEKVRVDVFYRFATALKVTQEVAVYGLC